MHSSISNDYLRAYGGVHVWSECRLTGKLARFGSNRDWANVCKRSLPHNGCCGRLRIVLYELYGCYWLSSVPRMHPLPKSILKYGVVVQFVANDGVTRYLKNKRWVCMSSQIWYFRLNVNILIWFINIIIFGINHYWQNYKTKLHYYKHRQVWKENVLRLSKYVTCHSRP